jgi:hypothetical protein
MVVSAPPSSENECIKEREAFGWNLQGRQEVIGHIREAETPDALGAAIWRGAIEGATNTKTVEYDHYVKLHFVRPVSLPSLQSLRTLEAQYLTLPVPNFPKLLPGGWLLLLFWYPFWPLYYFLSYRKKRAQADGQLLDLRQRQQEILTKAGALLS